MVVYLALVDVCANAFCKTIQLKMLQIIGKVRGDNSITNTGVRYRVAFEADSAIAPKTARHIEAVLIAVTRRPFAEALVNVCKCN